MPLPSPLDASAERRLAVGYALAVVAMVLAFNGLLALLWLMLPYVHRQPQNFMLGNTLLVLLYVLGGRAVETSRLKEGGRHVALMAGGREVQPGRGNPLSQLERRYVNVVHEVALTCGHQPPPACWVLPSDDAINALATGWQREDAVIAVTRGALERLTREELKGVVAHEFSHLLNGETRLNMTLVAMGWGLQMFWNVGLSLVAPDDRGRRRAVYPIGCILLAVGAPGWLAGRWLQARVSQPRELRADAAAAHLVRGPEALGNALRKVAAQQEAGRFGLLSAHTASLEHLMFAPTERIGLRRPMLATHPPLAERISRLLGRPAEPLDARVLPALKEDEALHPSLAALQSRRVDAVIGAAVPVAAEALRNDAMQRPSHFDAAAREADALARIARWQGPGEWQAAMLALTLDAGHPEAEVRWATWRQVTADLSVAAAVWTEVQVLRPPARRVAFEQLIAHARAQPNTARWMLWRGLRRRWQATGWCVTDAGQQWRALVLRHVLFGTPATPRAGRALETHGAAILAATRALVSTFGIDAASRDAWLTECLKGLQKLEIAPRSPAQGLAPLVPGREAWQALRVRRMAAMQRPLLLRTWVEAAQAAGLLDHTGTVDSLHLLCIALGMPMPEALRG